MKCVHEEEEAQIDTFNEEICMYVCMNTVKGIGNKLKLARKVGRKEGKKEVK